VPARHEALTGCLNAGGSPSAPYKSQVIGPVTREGVNRLQKQYSAFFPEHRLSMEHHVLKLVHISLAAASLAGFVLRWTLMMRGSSLINHPLTRSLPHIIDTAFLGAGIWLAIKISQAPFLDAWLTAKVFGLVAYIVLGVVAMKRAKTTHMRVLAFLAAILVFGWIYSVARSRSPWGLLAGLPG
jgi:uncharacterized membrane protein SirB2